MSCVFPVINGPTRITKASATAIDHIFTNTILDFEVQSGKIKTVIIAHFGIFCLKDSFKKKKNIDECIIRRNIIESSVKILKNLSYGKHCSYTLEWKLITQTLKRNDSHNAFIDKFLKIYDKVFPLRKITIKTKNRGSP